MQDPFPEENWAEKKFKAPKYDVLVYDRKRLKAGESPFCVFLPTKNIMFKMMRACVEVSDEADLWINNVAKGGSFEEDVKSGEEK